MISGSLSFLRGNSRNWLELLLHHTISLKLEIVVFISIVSEQLKIFNKIE